MSEDNNINLCEKKYDLTTIDLTKLSYDELLYIKEQITNILNERKELNTEIENIIVQINSICIT